MTREIHECQYTIDDVAVGEPFVADPEGWLAENAAQHGLTTLLAHADDGVMWGQIVRDRLSLSSAAFPEVSPPLRVLTLQQARLFGPQAELLIWRDGDGDWHGRLIDDQGGELTGWYFDEPQWLWGDHAEDKKDGFTLVAEGRQGLRHVVPLAAQDIPFDDSWHPLRLGVRHYLSRVQEDGMLIIAHSRLTGVWADRREEVRDE